MRFPKPLIPGRLIRRYKRFLADVILDDGREITAHTPNTGSMLGCQAPGSRVWLLDTGNPKRKYPHSWELVESQGQLVGINTGLANRLVEEAIVAGRLEALLGYATLRREVRYGDESSRIDLLLTDGPEPDAYVEVKNVTAAVQDGVAVFPDAPSVRAQKHLRELMRMVDAGRQAAVVFCVQRGDVGEVRPADAIDPAYGVALREAVGHGVSALALGADPTPESIVLDRVLPVVLP